MATSLSKGVCINNVLGVVWLYYVTVLGCVYKSCLGGVSVAMSLSYRWVGKFSVVTVHCT